MASTAIVSKCAACGNGGDNSNSLKICSACKSINYCSRECQLVHRPKHKAACKKRAAEIFDEALFKDPPPREECDICCLTLPLKRTQAIYNSCCGKTLCIGCMAGSRAICPFCRSVIVEDSLSNIHAKCVKDLEKRTKLNDANAFRTLACKYRDGMLGLPQCHEEAFALFSRAVELGSTEAPFFVGFSYYYGQGVEKDEKKGIHYFQLAAMRGDETARHNLGTFEHNARNFRNAARHWMISARSGLEDSIEMLQNVTEYVTKEEYDHTLRAHKKAHEGLKSEQRDYAAALYISAGGTQQM